MKASSLRHCCGIFTFFLLTLTCLDTAWSGEQKDMGGWGKESPYNRLYDASESDSFKATVVDIKEVTPLPGMSPGVALVVTESGSSKTLVHLCPVWYADTKAIGIRKGDRVKIKGVWAELNNEDIFMASKVKKGDYFEFKVRLTKDGTPFWSMTPEELKKGIHSQGQMLAHNIPIKHKTLTVYKYTK